MASALSFAVLRLIHCPLGKTSGTLVLNTINKTSAKVQASALQTFTNVFVDRNPFVNRRLDVSSCEWLMSPNKDETCLSLSYLMIEWYDMINPLINLSLFWHLKVQSLLLLCKLSPIFSFVVLNINIYIQLIYKIRV